MWIPQEMPRFTAGATPLRRTRRLIPAAKSIPGVAARRDHAITLAFYLSKFVQYRKAV